MAKLIMCYPSREITYKNIYQFLGLSEPETEFNYCIVLFIHAYFSRGKQIGCLKGLSALVNSDRSSRSRTGFRILAGGYSP